MTVSASSHLSVSHVMDFSRFSVLCALTVVLHVVQLYYMGPVILQRASFLIMKIREEE